METTLLADDGPRDAADWGRPRLWFQRPRRSHCVGSAVERFHRRLGTVSDVFQPRREGSLSAQP